MNTTKRSILNFKCVCVHVYLCLEEMHMRVVSMTVRKGSGIPWS